MYIYTAHVMIHGDRLHVLYAIYLKLRIYPLSRIWVSRDNSILLQLFTHTCCMALYRLTYLYTHEEVIAAFPADLELQHRNIQLKPLLLN